jgi:peptidyl-prolyl cis-trans isomerase SurA
VFRKSLKAAVCALAAGTALAACGPVQPGAAAIIGHDRITVSKLDSAVDRWNKELPKYPQAQQVVQNAQAQPGGNPGSIQPFDPSSPQRSALFLLIEMRAWSELAREQGISVSQGQVDAFVAKAGGRESLETVIVAQGLPTSYADDFARTAVLQQAIDGHFGVNPNGATTPQEQAANQRLAIALLAAAHRLGVTVDPRYGTFNDKTMQFGPVCPQLSTPDSGTPDGPTGELKCQL